MKIHFDEIEFNPTCPVYTVTASYRGEPFTGTAYFIDENFGTYYEWNYQNGNAHGRWFGMNLITKKLINEEFYIDGIGEGTFRNWFDNGEIEFVSKYENDNCVFTMRWTKNGVLIKHYDRSENIDKEFYDNGKLYYDTEFTNSNGFITTFFNENGIWIMKNIGPYKNAQGKYSSRFHESELLNQSYSLNSTFHNIIVQQFIWHLRRTNESVAVDYLIDLLTHTDSVFKAEAIIRLGELKVEKAVPLLQGLLHDETKPYRINRFQGKELANLYSISALAQRSLNKIL